jgi:hypothetical protein
LQLTRIAGPRIARFESWLLDVLTADRVILGTSMTPVADLVGLGSGLTPSGDDFLVGALAVLDALAERRAHAALARMIFDLPPGLTSALSECLLKAAAAGYVGEDLHCAVSAVISGMPSRAIAAIGRIGHSSGWDSMAGILTALRAVATARGDDWGKRRSGLSCGSSPIAAVPANTRRSTRPGWSNAV